MVHALLEFPAGSFFLHQMRMDYSQGSVMHQKFFNFVMYGKAWQRFVISGSPMPLTLLLS